MTKLFEKAFKLQTLCAGIRIKANTVLGVYGTDCYGLPHL